MTDSRLRLYDYPASCNCYKVRLLMSHLGLAYDRVAVDIFNGDTLTPAYTAINPQRTTPVLPTPDGRYLPESNAILLYLAIGTGLLPEEPIELAEVVRWLIFGLEVLALLDEHLRAREFMVADRYTAADVAIYGYGHVAGDAGFDLTAYPSLQAWLSRVEQQPGYIEDVEPYGANAAPGAGQSIYS